MQRMANRPEAALFDKNCNHLNSNRFQECGVLCFRVRIEAVDDGHVTSGMLAIEIWQTADIDRVNRVFARRKVPNAS